MTDPNSKRRPLYVPLAKLALWVTAFVLSSIVCALGVFVVTDTSPNADRVAFLGVVVQGCQVLSIITLAVLGYRGHKGE